MGYSQKNNTEQLADDILFLKTELPEKHFDFFRYHSENEFNKDIQNLIDSLKYFNKSDVIFRLSSIIARAKDAHTELSFKPTNIYPVGYKMFQGKVYLMAVPPKFNENELPFGNEVISLNGIPTQAILNQVKKVTVIDNDSSLKKKFNQYFTNRDYMEYAGVPTPDSLTIELLTKDGNKMFYKVQSVKSKSKPQMASFGPTKKAYYLSKKMWFWTDVLQDSILYVRYQKCSGKEHLISLREHFKGNPKYNFTDEQLDKVPSFKKFHKDVIRQLNRKQIKYLVFDIRGNSGGTSVQGTKLIKDIAGIDKINVSENIYLLIDYNNFSSAVINIMDFKNLTNAILVGEIPWGTPNHFGEVSNFELPNSKTKVYYSTKYFKRSEKNIIMPDVILEPSLKDYLGGKDVVLDYTIHNIQKENLIQ